MKYELKVSAISGDVIPLRDVADAMARAASTTYGGGMPKVQRAELECWK